MSHAVTEPLAWALVHFVWQGALIALAAACAAATLGRARPGVRYALFCGALLLMILAPVATLVVSGGEAAPASLAPAVIAPEPASLAHLPMVPAPAPPAWPTRLVPLWLSAVVALSLRSLCGWLLIERLKRWQTAPAGEALERAARSLCARLGMRRRVRILTTVAAEVPAALGCLRPVVLLPLSALTSLTPEQIEHVLAHELAHIRRHDYLVNLLQTVVENLLFYHPAVWWVSARIRAEREHCCDDLAVQACGDVAGYAGTLARLERGLASRPVLALAADGGSLLARIQRLAGREQARRDAPPAWLAGLFPIAAVLAAALSSGPPRAEVVVETRRPGDEAGFLGGLAAAGYTELSVEEIIALKEHGVEPRTIRGMLGCGLGTPTVEQLIRLRNHGVEPGFVAAVAASRLVADLDFESVIRLRENDVQGEDLRRIRELGFGPFTADEVIELRRNGADAATFEALKEAGADHAGVAEAVLFRQNDVTPERIRALKAQGFGRLSVEQIVKLRRAGIL